MTSQTHFRSLFYFLATLLSFLSISFACAADKPIDIAADTMSSDEASNSVTFIGNVDVKQGDVRIRSNKMVVYYTPQQDKKGNRTVSSSQQVEKMVCTGNVEVSRADWLGTGDRMDYFERKRQAILIGNARAFKGQNEVRGSKIIYYLDENRSEVIAGKKKGKKGRVKMKLK